jgi:DNA-binding PadR family transcriptional regulator
MTAERTPSRTRMANSPLRGPLLALLMRQRRPTHAYRLTGLLSQGLRGWDVQRWTVGELLNGLEAEGIVSSAQAAGKKVYSPTERAEPALDEWIAKAVSRPPMRDDLLAMIAASCPRHAPLLLRALDATVRDCRERLSETDDARLTLGSWTSLTIDLTRSAAEEQLRARIRWANTARRRIEECRPTCSQPPP